jgi:hypothetical protein
MNKKEIKEIEKKIKLMKEELYILEERINLAKKEGRFIE